MQSSVSLQVLTNMQLVRNVRLQTRTLAAEGLRYTAEAASLE